MTHCILRHNEKSASNSCSVNPSFGSAIWRSFRTTVSLRDSRLASSCITAPLYFARRPVRSRVSRPIRYASRIDAIPCSTFSAVTVSGRCRFLWCDMRVLGFTARSKGPGEVQ